MSGQRHPDEEALARYKAGLVGGFRGRRLAAHVADCAHCASVSDQLTEVSTVLASVPAPAMPAAVERQIMAALATEAAARQTASPATGSPKAPRHRDRARGRRFSPVMGLVSAAACLLLAGFGYLLSLTGSSSSSSMATSAGVPAASGPIQRALAPEQAPAAGSAVSPSPADLRPGASLSGEPFVVVESGTKYEQATLSTQVREELARKGTASASPGPLATAGSQAAGSTGGLPPPRSLVGCVSHLTGKVRPSLVDQATYQGNPVYVIAVAGHAWVVGRGCTASNTELITSVTLPASG